MAASDEGGKLEAQSLAPHLKQLRCVLAVCRAGSTARASEALPLSQSAIARAIRQLESSLGLTIFDRGARGMLATAEGRLLAHRASRAMAQLELAETEAARLADEAARRLEFGRGRFSGACSHRHLQTYIAFCESRGESAAARRLGVSQPAVNQALRQVEHMLGTRLFQRSSRGMRLTESGEAVLRRAKLAMDELRHAHEDLGALRGRMRGRIVVGSLPLSAGVLVPRAVDRVLSRHRDLHVTIVDGTYDALLNQLLHADVDVIVGALRPWAAGPEIVQETLFTDTLCVVARRGHPLLDEPPCGLRELEAAPWIAPLSGTPAREAFERAFAAEGVAAPRGLLEANSAVVVQALLMDSDRLALLSRRQIVRGVSAGLLAVVPLQIHETERQIGLTMRADADPGSALRMFMDEIRLLAQEDL
ncbi:LysR family transcriptional regulator [Pusillimonas noertemannii]|uniref:LysR family transcriptional regulator n=1 Tax=Pusillimonas noertemannii TaxID=305977 RepID=A0A2U1CI57_9BURK|nr:LysR family transcriptional regulator [Pusillimonas noertemannii]NYT70438.1 LysR family transcriptional regulator [Pusillimonas noertemannii]PVY60638.1 LysR family transcriptional regulator [Pusillimonas noertemannii]TFL08647.1 LysR family transcriptional regulator [Pusillimonas noertemannii]